MNQFLAKLANSDHTDLICTGCTQSKAPESFSPANSPSKPATPATEAHKIMLYNRIARLRLYDGLSAGAKSASLSKSQAVLNYFIYNRVLTYQFGLMFGKAFRHSSSHQALRSLPFNLLSRAARQTVDSDASFLPIHVAAGPPPARLLHSTYSCSAFCTVLTHHTHPTSTTEQWKRNEQHLSKHQRHTDDEQSKNGKTMTIDKWRFGDDGWAEHRDDEQREGRGQIQRPNCNYADLTFIELSVVAARSAIDEEWIRRTRGPRSAKVVGRVAMRLCDLALEHGGNDPTRINTHLQVLLPVAPMALGPVTTGHDLEPTITDDDADSARPPELPVSPLPCHNTMTRLHCRLQSVNNAPTKRGRVQGNTRKRGRGLQASSRNSARTSLGFFTLIVLVAQHANNLR
ncbi:hypothetical protein C8F01DRAFT_1084396 [Mycena amicta]|nr:hypothetical protein C8F01DRAFT_1084396 [Mycena amicta]